MPATPPLHRLLLLAAASVLAACASLKAPRPDAAYVVIGNKGAATVRAITSAAVCPDLRVDGQSRPMAVRAPLGAIPARAPESAPAAVLTCEAPLPAGARHASVGGMRVGVPVASPTRIVVIGDTGCRLSKDEQQDCNDARAFPFATVAAAAAAWHPDLVIHVGDYHYRETPCPATRPGCAGSPFGYGWAAWKADFFAPARPLLAAAPWVMARGNHELCKRGGQGFLRFLDPHPLNAQQDCNAPADDATGNYSEPYAVPLGGQAQLIVFDSADASYKGFPAGDPRLAHYGALYHKIDALAQQAPYNIGVNHHPLLDIGALRDKAGAVTYFGGDAGLLQAFIGAGADVLPSRVQMLLSGHVHLWEQISFSSGHPTQFVSGFAGTAEDIVPLPERAPPGFQPAPGAVVAHLSSWIDGFGFMTMERTGPDSWTVRVHDRDGVVRNTCAVRGKQSACAVAQVH